MKHFTLLAFFVGNFAYSQTHYVSIGSSIYEMDPTTCVETLACNVVINTGGGTSSSTLNDIAYHPNGLMYVLAANWFLSIDINTCATTTIASHTTGCNALVADANGILYGAADSLYTIDPVTGVFTAIGELPCSSGGDLAFHDGQLYLTCLSGDLMIVDINNPIASTVVGNLGAGNWYGIWTVFTACDSSQVYVSNENDVYQLDVTNATTTYACSLPQWSWIGGGTMINDFMASACGCPVDLGADTSLCAGNITLNAGDPNYTYLWNNSSTDSTLVAGSPGTYWVSITDTTTGCTNSDTLVITSGAGANAGTGASTALCVSDPSSDLFNLITSSPDTTGTWSGPSALGGGSLGSFDPGTNSAGTYLYIVTGACGNDTAFLNVTLDQMPVYSLIDDTTICENETITLSLPGTYSYDWDSGTSSSNSYMISHPNSGNYWHYVTITGGACSINDSTQINVINCGILNLTLNGDTTLCEGQCTDLTAQAMGGTPPYSFLWSDGFTGDSLHTICPSSTAGYYVIVTDGNGDDDTVFFNLTVNPMPIISVSNDTTIALGATAQLWATGAITYSWTPISSLSCSSCPNPVASPTVTTQYQVTGILNGCSATNFITVTVLFDDEIFIPTAFSPNNDGLNDAFGVLSNAFDSYQLMVFDRWGGMVFRSENPSEKWDGTVDGKQSQTGVYHYMLQGKLLNQEVINRGGSVTLLR